MAYNLPQRGLDANIGKQLETGLGTWIRKHDLGLQAQVEIIQSPSLFEQSTDFIFTVATTLQESAIIADGELPFKTRLKAVLKVCCESLPDQYPFMTWEVPQDSRKFIDPKIPLTPDNLAASITYKEMFDKQGPYIHGCRFRIRATETFEAMVNRAEAT